MDLRKLLKSKKGFEVSDVPHLGMVLLVVAVVLGVGMTILDQIAESSQCDSPGSWDAEASMCRYAADGENYTEFRSLGFNATYSGMAGLKTLSDWQEWIGGL